MSPPVGQPVGGGAPSSDASDPPPASDAAVAPPADAGADAAADTGTTPEDASLPSDGLFVPCDTVDDCKAGLACYGAGFFGYCSQPCQESSECTDVDGVDFTCSPNEFACRVDCSADGTDGVCPQGLTCVDFTIDARCLPPGTGGTGDRQLFAPCDVANGDADCVDGLSCYRSTESLIDSPGYCTLDCAGLESLCSEMDVSPAELECEQSRCRFACSDAPCPDGMTCEEIGGDGVCHYPPG